MTAPTIRNVQNDGQLGSSNPSAQGPVILIGVSSTGPLNAMVGYTRPQAVAAVYGKGPLVEAARYFIARGLTVIPMRAGGTEYGGGTCGSPIVDADSALLWNVSVSEGAPDDGYEILVDFPVGGTVGTAGIFYRYSLDDGRGGMSPRIALGTATTIAIPGTADATNGTPVVLEIANTPEVVAGDEIRLTTLQEELTAEQVDDALEVIAAYTGSWDQLHLVGPCTSTIFDAIDLFMNSLPDQYMIDRYAVTSFRRPLGEPLVPVSVPPGDPETEAEYLAAFVDEFGGTASALGYTMVCAGSVEVVTNGISYRREVGFPVAAKIASVPEQVNVAQRVAPGGSLVGCTFGTDQYGIDDHDESMNPGLDDARACTLRRWPDKQGVYVTWPKTLAASGSDFDRVTRRRVMNTGLGAGRAFSADLIAKDLFIDPVTGYLQRAERSRLNELATSAVKKALRGKVSYASVTYAADDDLTAAEAELNATLDIVPKGEVHDVKITAGFKARLSE